MSSSHVNQPSRLHSHHYLSETKHKETKVLIVFFITLVTMFAEIGVGTWSGSMALLADGWHMGTHAAAFAIAMFAYAYARKHSQNSQFSFGTGKVNYLGGFASAIALLIVALLMLVESLHRLWSPQNIAFDEALVVAFIGLIVNVISVFVLHDDHHHNHDDEHHEHHEHHGQDEHSDHDDKHSGHHHKDHNLTAAYFHVLADTLTSVLAILALFAGRYFGWLWMDALMGIVGAVIITKWALGLITQTSAVLLDKTISPSSIDALKQAIECDADAGISVEDIHLWTLSEGHNGAILSVRATEGQHNKTCDEYRQLVATHLPKASHITVEMN